MYDIDQETCRKVADCVEACPIGAIEMQDDGRLHIGDSCTDCGACEEVCDARAIRPA